VSTRRSSNLVAAGIFLSRISGLLRERAISHFLGLSPATEAFRVALRIPNLLQNLLGEGVLSASFIPVYSRLLAAGREREAGEVAGAIAGLLTALTGALVLVGITLAEPIVGLVAPGFSGQQQQLTATLIRVTTPALGVLVLSAWCLGVLNSHRRFFLSYVAPVVWNAAQIAALIAAAVVLTGGLSVEADPGLLTDLATALAWGVLGGGVLQLAVQLPLVWRLTGGVWPSLRTGHAGVREAVGAFVPIVAARGGVQLSAFLDVVLASLLAGAAVAALSAAQVLYLLPISLFGMSMAAAELPELSARQDDDAEALGQRVRFGLARIAFFVLPTAALFIAAGDHVVGAILQTGQFDLGDTLVVWAVLAGYALGLLAATASRLLQSALYAAGAARVVARASLLRVALSAVVGAALMLQLDRVALTPQGLALAGDLPALGPLPAGQRAELEGAGRLGAVGLSLAASAGLWLEYGLLRRAVAARLATVRLGGGVLGRTAAATAVLVAVILALRPLVEGWHPLAAGAVVAAGAGVAYLAAAWRLGLEEPRALVAAVVGRMRR